PSWGSIAAGGLHAELPLRPGDAFSPRETSPAGFRVWVAEQPGRGGCGRGAVRGACEPTPFVERRLRALRAAGGACGSIESRAERLSEHLEPEAWEGTEMGMVNVLATALRPLAAWPGAVDGAGAPGFPG
ncbi:hypothetical protein LTR53_017288, partial [Teratosphaeriaceae sp. CCFEE 6253]